MRDETYLIVTTDEAWIQYFIPRMRENIGPKAPSFFISETEKSENDFSNKTNYGVILWDMRSVLHMSFNKSVHYKCQVLVKLTEVCTKNNHWKQTEKSTLWLVSSRWCGSSCGRSDDGYNS